MKRLIFLLLGICLLLPVVTAAEQTEVDRITDTIRLLEIMNGDENGNLNLDDNVTRAEFVKMSLFASTYKNTVDTLPKVSLFPDVRSNHWASRYISAAISNGWINGYLDGTFRPENNVKLEEAVNIVLKILGYTQSDLIGAYPQPQLENYIALGLDKNIDRAAGELLTRRDCMFLIYNMLNTKNKNGVIYAQALGYTLNSNDEIDYLEVVEKNKKGPILASDEWQKKTGIPGSKMKVWRDGKSALAEDIKNYDVLYYSPLINTVWAYSEKQFGTLQSVTPASSPTNITVAGKNYSLANSEIKYKFSSMGEFAVDDIVVLMLGTDGKVEFAFNAEQLDYNIYLSSESDYALLTQYSLDDAFVVENASSLKDKIPFDLNTAHVYKNGSVSSVSQINKYDVVYYSKLLNSIWSYDVKKSGIVNGVSPSKSSPTSVNLSGTNYSIASENVSFSLSELGTIDSGDVVTLLLGRDNMVEGIITPDASDSSLYIQGDLSYDQIVNASMEGPYIVNGNSYKTQIPFDIEKSFVYRNNEVTTADDICEWDVYYYSEPLKTVWVYSDTVSGKYESALPDQSAPQSIVVSGKTYSIEASSVSYKLSSAGDFSIGENITLLLGKGGAVAGVVKVDELSKEVIGIVTDFYTKEYYNAYGGTYTSNCIVVTELDGDTMEYSTALTSMKVGKMVSVKVLSSGTKVNVISKDYTSVKDLNNALKYNKFAPDAQIADLCCSSLAPVYQSRLENCVLDKSDVIYYKLNNQGEITILVLDDYIGDNHNYVMLTSVTENYSSRQISGNYKYFGSAGEASLTVSTVFGVSDGPAYIEYDGKSVSEIRNLNVGVAIDRVGNLMALSGEVTYNVWDKVQIFEYKNGQYRVLSMSDIENNDKYSLTGWLNDNVSRGGIIRMIIAVPNK